MELSVQLSERLAQRSLRHRLLRLRRGWRGPIGLLLGLSLRLRWALLGLLLAVLANLSVQGPDEQAAEPIQGWREMPVSAVAARAEPDMWERLDGATASPAAARVAGASSSASATSTATSDESLLYGSNGRAIDPDGMGVQQRLEQHARAARLGDHQAAYAVYQALAVCAAVDQPADVTAARRRAQCVGVSPAQVQERMMFLKRAADGGLAVARIDRFVEEMRRAGDAASIEGDQEQQAELAQSLQGLKDAAGQCEPEAMGLLASVYDAGVLLPSDARQVLMYRFAELHARRMSINAAHLRSVWGESLSDAEFAQVREAGRRLAESACKP